MLYAPVPLWRRIVVAAALLVMLAAVIAFFWNERHFRVDDTRFSEEIAAAAGKYGLDGRLVRSLIYQETRFDPSKVGRAGEIGLMQIRPETSVRDWARAMKCPVPDKGALFAPQLNLEIGCWYLSRLMQRYRTYRSGTELTLAAYNAGLSRVAKWKPEAKNADPETVIDAITIDTTRRYVTDVMARYRRYCGEERAGVGKRQ